MKAIRHLFWDFDGTLYDSYPQITDAFAQAMEAMALSPMPTRQNLLKELKVSVYHAADFYAQHYGVDSQELMGHYRGFERQTKLFFPYAGLAECLEALHAAGFHHYLYTHRDRKAIEQLETDDLWHLFDDAVVRTDGFADKPAPDALLAMMARNHLTPDVCAMVGDRDIDIQAGQNAGMSGILFDPDGFYAHLPAALRVTSLTELQQSLLG